MTAEEKKVIFASSLGTVFEWYDFYLYGALSAIIAKQFFAGLDDTLAFIAALLAFAAGFLVRPFGALVFGRLGDLVGRKYTFLVTITLMGLSTFIVGLIPTYASIGLVAPIALVALRIVQGLALGGEYGGAATYVAEHAPQGRRGFYTAWIQTTATLGLFLSLLVILGTRTYLTEPVFADWGWRVPFLLSIVLLGISVWIRMQLSESPAFKKMKAEGTGSKAPISEAFGQWRNAKVALIALFGLVMGQAVVWYSGQFYALIFMTKKVLIDEPTANILIAIALLIGTPGFIFFGWLSDRIGRKPIILAGCAIAALTYFSVFQGLMHYGNPALEAAQAGAKIAVVADPAECAVQFDPIGKAKFTSSCDVAKAFLAKNAVSYTNEAAPAGTPAVIRVGDVTIPSFSPSGLEPAAAKAKDGEFQSAIFQALKAANFPVATKVEKIKKDDGTEVEKTSFSMAPADHAKMNTPMLLVLLTFLVILVTMVYGPIAAMLVELFPTRIRYTAMSLPYHIGNGWFGGLLPVIAVAMVVANGNTFYGLWYPIVIAAATVVIGLIFVPETKDRDIYKDD